MAMKFSLNGQLLQEGTTAQMIHTVPEQVSLRQQHHHAAPRRRHRHGHAARCGIRAQSADPLKAGDRIVVQLRERRHAEQSRGGVGSGAVKILARALLRVR